MTLRQILNDKNSINILKALYDQSNVLGENKILDFSQISSKANITGKADNSLELLDSTGLIHKDTIKKQINIGITEKGRQFILIFDQLVALMRDKKSKQTKRSFKIEYGLTNIEKKILILVYKVGKETGSGVNLLDLSDEIYALNEFKDKKERIIPYVDKMVGLGLMLKEEIGSDYIISLTDRGKKTIKGQIMEELIDNY